MSKIKLVILLSLLSTAILTGCVNRNKDQIKTRELGYCESKYLPDSRAVNRCYADDAIKSNNVTICDKQSPLSKPMCYTGFATERQNLTICDQLEQLYNESTKNDCYIFVADAKNDSSICNLISNQKNRDRCYSSLATDDLEICKKSSTPDTCYHLVAISLKNTEVCTKITDTTSKDSCLFVLATKEKDCEKISEDFMRSHCLENLRIPNN